MTGSTTPSDDDRDDRELAEFRRRRKSFSWRLRAPLRTAEHRARRWVADRRLPSRPVSALPQALAGAKTFGDPAVLDSTRRIAVVASYSSTNEVSKSLSALVHEFETNDYRVVLVRASASGEGPVWPAQGRAPSLVITKPNIGYDFGSWATALAMFPAIARMPLVILANDSLLGPFGALKPMIAQFEKSATDVWGATSTEEFIPHLQSYLLGFKDGVLGQPAVRAFWKSIRVIDDKDAIVTRYEIGLSRLLTTEGFLSRSWFDHAQIVPEGGNPTTIGGSRLVSAGFPFVKRILIENPDIFPDAAVASALVAERYGQDVRDWI